MTLFLMLLLAIADYGDYNSRRPVHGFRPTRPAVTAPVHPTAPIIRLYNQW